MTVGTILDAAKTLLRASTENGRRVLTESDKDRIILESRVLAEFAILAIREPERVIQGVNE